MTICFGVFSFIMLFGFRTFGTATQALILNNYHRTEDSLASLARIATGCSILCGYPLMFAALKTSFFNAASEVAEKLGGTGGSELSRRFQVDERLRLGERTEGEGEERQSTLNRYDQIYTSSMKKSDHVHH